MKKTALLVFAALSLAACGGDKPTVALQLTDAPPDTDSMQSVFVTLARAEVHVANKGAKEDGDPNDDSIDGDKSWVTIDLGGSEAYDLLTLQNDVTAFLGENEVPEGKITQIRLFLDAAGRNEIVMKDGQVCALDLSEVPQKGIKINHPFKAIEVAEGDAREITVDFDVKESVDQEGACAFKLKPVIKIKKVK